MEGGQLCRQDEGEGGKGNEHEIRKSGPSEVLGESQALYLEQRRVFMNEAPPPAIDVVMAKDANLRGITSRNSSIVFISAQKGYSSDTMRNTKGIMVLSS